jgi:hypothetical protein
LVEQRIENPRVGGSIPPQATRIPQASQRVMSIPPWFCRFGSTMVENESGQTLVEAVSGLYRAKKPKGESFDSPFLHFWRSAASARR